MADIFPIKNNLKEVSKYLHIVDGFFKIKIIEFFQMLLSTYGYNHVIYISLDSLVYFMEEKVSFSNCG